MTARFIVQESPVPALPAGTGRNESSEAVPNAPADQGRRVILKRPYSGQNYIYRHHVEPWLALVSVALLAAALLRLGWVDVRLLAAAVLVEALRAVATAVFGRPALPPAASSDPPAGEKEG
jgi:hypothetical protein